MNRNLQIKIGAFTFILIISFIIINLAAFFYQIHVEGLNIYDKKSYRAFKNERLNGNLVNANSMPSITHPFIGKLELGAEIFRSNLSNEPLFSRVDKSEHSNEIKVLILGGSVAMYTSHNQNEGLFAKRLNNIFSTNKFSVYNAAFGGGKQPSQYFKLLYLDLLGFKPDIIINIDGFNEIALPATENLNIKNPAIFPRDYSAHVDSTSNYARGCIKYTDEIIKKGSLLPIVVLYQDITSRQCREGLETQNMPWWAGQIEVPDYQGYIDQSYEIWLNSSNKINNFAKWNNIDYIHILQPNQYYPESKTFSEEENLKAVAQNRWGEAIKLNYKRLSSTGIETVNFYDQRMIFQNTKETVYIDKCCHLNLLGNQIIIDDMISRFRVIFENKLASKVKNP